MYVREGGRGAARVQLWVCWFGWLTGSCAQAGPGARRSLSFRSEDTPHPCPHTQVKEYTADVLNYKKSFMGPAAAIEVSM